LQPRGRGGSPQTRSAPTREIVVSFDCDSGDDSRAEFFIVTFVAGGIAGTATLAPEADLASCQTVTGFSGAHFADIDEFQDRHDVADRQAQPRTSA
jgi:hypothetical protein